MTLSAVGAGSLSGCRSRRSLDRAFVADGFDVEPVVVLGPEPIESAGFVEGDRGIVRSDHRQFEATPPASDRGSFEPFEEPGPDATPLVIGMHVEAIEVKSSIVGVVRNPLYESDDIVRFRGDEQRTIGRGNVVAGEPVGIVPRIDDGPNPLGADGLIVRGVPGCPGDPLNLTAVGFGRFANFGRIHTPLFGWQ